MKYKEFFDNANGIFTTTFGRYFPEDVQPLFGEMNPQEADCIALLQYGNRLLCEPVTAENYRDIVKALFNAKFPNWKRVADALNADYSVTTADSVTETKTGSNTLTGQSENSSLVADKVFNDDTFNDGNRKTDTGTDSRTENTESTTTRTVVASADKTAQAIQRELEIRQYNVALGIIREVVGFITLSIY